MVGPQNVLSSINVVQTCVVLFYSKLSKIFPIPLTTSSFYIQENKIFRKVFNAEYVHIFTVSFTDPDVYSFYVKSYELGLRYWELTLHHQTLFNRRLFWGAITLGMATEHKLKISLLLKTQNSKVYAICSLIFSVWLLSDYWSTKHSSKEKSTKSQK